MGAYYKEFALKTMQGVKVSQAQKAFDEMNGDSVEKKVTYLRVDLYL